MPWVRYSFRTCFCYCEVKFGRNKNNQSWRGKSISRAPIWTHHLWNAIHTCTQPLIFHVAMSSNNLKWWIWPLTHFANYSYSWNECMFESYMGHTFKVARLSKSMIRAFVASVFFIEISEMETFRWLRWTLVMFWKLIFRKKKRSLVATGGDVRAMKETINNEWTKEACRWNCGGKKKRERRAREDGG